MVERVARAGNASDVAAAVAAAASPLTGSSTFFVGIDGPGAAGKTTFTDRVCELLCADGVDVQVVHIDDFSAMQLDEWDWDRFRAQVLLPLLDGRASRYQVWDWDRDTGGGWVDVHPGGVVLVEGVSSTRREAGVPWSLTVWVDAPADLRRERAIARDGAAMWPVWRDRWIPSEDAYKAREQPERRCDFVVTGTSDVLGEWTS